MADLVIAQERFSYTLFQRDQQHLLTYLSGGPIETDRTVELSDELAATVSESPKLLHALVHDLLAGSSPVGVSPLPVSTWPAP